MAVRKPSASSRAYLVEVARRRAGESMRFNDNAKLDASQIIDQRGPVSLASKSRVRPVNRASAFLASKPLKRAANPALSDALAQKAKARAGRRAFDPDPSYRRPGSPSADGGRTSRGSAPTPLPRYRDGGGSVKFPKVKKRY